MIITLGTYADLLAAKGVLGKPNALLFRVVTGVTTLVALYCDFALKINDGTVSAPNQAAILGDFPDAVEVSLVTI